MNSLNRAAAYWEAKSLGERNERRRTKGLAKQKAALDARRQSRVDMFAAARAGSAGNLATFIETRFPAAALPSAVRGTAAGQARWVQGQMAKRSLWECLRAIVGGMAVKDALRTYWHPAAGPAPSEAELSRAAAAYAQQVGVA